MQGKAIISPSEVSGKGWAETGRALTTSEHPAGISHLAFADMWGDL